MNNASAFATLEKMEAALWETLAMVLVEESCDVRVAAAKGAMWAPAKADNGGVCFRLLKKLYLEGLVTLKAMLGAPFDACERRRQMPHGMLPFSAKKDDATRVGRRAN